MALADLERILYGSHIRMSELVNNLSIPLVYSRTQTRAVRYLKSTPELLKHKEVLLFGSRGRFFDSILLQLLKSHGAKIIYDAADLPHLQNFYFGDSLIDNGLAKKFYTLVGFADILVIISESARILFSEEAIKGKEIFVVPNASDPDFFRVEPTPKGTKTVLYVGGYAPARGIDDLAIAFGILSKRHRTVTLRLIGANMPLKFKSDKVTVEQDKVYSNMPDIHAQAYMCVIPHKRNPYMDAALPVKLFDAMASARPVVVTDCTEIKRFVENEKCGVVAHDNSQSLSEAMEYLLQNPRVATEMGNRGREAILKRHSWKCRAEDLRAKLKL